MVKVEVVLNIKGALAKLIDFEQISFTEEIWSETRQRLSKFMASRVSSIRKRSVSEATRKWRKSMAVHGKSVETYKDSYRPVISGASVGMRTGTLLGDMETSSPPGIREEFGSNEMDNIPYGEYTYYIPADIFAKSYPSKYFNPYSVARGIVEESLVEVNEDQAYSLLDSLSVAVKNHLIAKWYSNVH